MSKIRLIIQENRFIHQVVYQLFKECEWCENQLQCFLDKLPYEQRNSKTIIEAILAHAYGKWVILPADDIELTNWRFLMYVLSRPTTHEDLDLMRNYTKESLQQVLLNDDAFVKALLDLIQRPAHSMAWQFFEQGAKKPKVPNERPLPPMQRIQDILH